MTRLGAERFHIRFPAGATYSSVLKTESRAHPDSCSVVYAGLKRLGRETDHAPSYSADLKNEWSYTSTPICLRGMLRDSFMFAATSEMQLVSERALTERE